MAGEWIKVRTNLATDPRVSRLCDLTDERTATVLGGLQMLWASADEHTEDGHMPGLSIKGIDRNTSIPGFGNALLDVGWIEDTEGGITLIRFEDHNGASAKQRAQTAKRVANHKVRNQLTPDHENTNAPTVNDALPREEKRREELQPTPLPPEPENFDLTQSPSDDDVRKCPVGQIVNLYHELMPNNPRVKVVNEARKSAIRQRWREAASLNCKPFGYASKSDGLAAWRKFFEVCATSQFLTGLSPPAAGKRAFIADVEFIFSPSGFAKILENKYHRETKP